MRVQFSQPSLCCAEKGKKKRLSKISSVKTKRIMSLRSSPHKKSDPFLNRFSKIKYLMLNSKFFI